MPDPRVPGLASAFTAFPRDAVGESIPARFEWQVRRFPDRLAVKTSFDALTYDALNRRANRLARMILARLGDGQEPVALLFEHVAPLVAGLLATLKTGKINVTLDPTFPESRLASMLSDCQARVIVTNTRNLPMAETLAQRGCAVLDVDAEGASYSLENLGTPLTADALACILYTSGSTGRPKGVVHSHRTLLHATANYTDSIQIRPDDRLTLLWSCTAIGAARDTFGALLNGAALYPFDVKDEGVAGLARWLVQEEITVYNSVTTLFRHLVGPLLGTERFPRLRLVKFGGEPATTRDVELFRQHCPEDSLLYLVMAATETGGSVREFFIGRDTQFPGSVAPLGYAVPDMEILLLDEDGGVIADGGVGEIAVRSRYLAVGYWRQPDLTRTVFLPDPLGTGARIYRTGDLGRLLSDGCLQHLGRKDFQVKIRGFRVETAEIELTLLEHAAVAESVVVAREEQPGDTRLVAYVVSTGPVAPSVGELRRFVQEKLPDHMVPTTFVKLDALPLTPTGKVDRRALPPPERGNLALDTPYVMPRTSIEEALVEIWADVLEVPQVGVNDNFLELGGHSLLATRIIARVRNTFGVEVPLRVFLDAPTVAGMATAIVQEQAARMDPGVLAGLLAAIEGRSEREAHPGERREAP